MARNKKNARRVYNNYMQSDAWKAKREEKFLQAGRVCSRANKRCSKRLDVHHLTYEALGHEPLDHLLVLCTYHHIRLHLYSAIWKRCKKVFRNA